MNPKIILIVSWLMLSDSVIAGSLETIYDSGETFPVTPYLRRDEPPMSAKSKIFDGGSPLAQLFPLATPGLSPGQVSSREIKLPYIQTPLFIVGSDTYSKEWLAYRREELIELGAVGMFIEGGSLKDFEDLKRIGYGLHLFPASGETLVKTLDLKHYPVLVTKFRIEQ